MWVNPLEFRYLGGEQCSESKGGTLYEMGYNVERVILESTSRGRIGNQVVLGLSSHGQDPFLRFLPVKVECRDKIGEEPEGEMVM